MKVSDYHVPIVVRIRREGGVVVQGCDVYIGRRATQGGWNLQSSVWANPFNLKTGRKKVIRDYETFLRNEIKIRPNYWLPYLVRLISAGRPLTLGCWCKDKPDIQCHGDVIVKICQEIIDTITSL